MNDTLLQQAATLLQQIDRDIVAPHHGAVAGAAQKIKADASLVTQYDRDSEAALQALTKITPGACVIGEEQIDADPEAFSQLTRSQRVWVVDPIDGTGAFARGEPTYAIVAVLIEEGISTHGVIYIPGITRVPGREHEPARPLLVQAKRGSGCYLNGRRVDLSGRPHSMTRARISFACRNQHQPFEAILAQGVPGFMSRGNAAHDYATLLAGDRDAVFYSEGYTPEGEGKCPPWDHGAGALAVQEAGGIVGLPYASLPQPYHPRHRYDQVLVASSLPLWMAVQAHVVASARELTIPRKPGSLEQTLEGI